MATEEQTAYDTYQNMYSGNFLRQGQRLTIPNREVTKLGFWLEKVGSPTGDITFTIRQIDNTVLLSKVWGDASGLQGTVNYEEATFDTPVTINEEVRILAEWGGGDSDNRLEFQFKDSDVKESEFRTEMFFDTTWYDRPAKDAAYIYTYGEEAKPAGGGFADLIAAGII